MLRYDPPVRYGIIITGGQPAEQIDLAKAAEAAGWDGVFTWDAIHVGDEIEAYDPFALMAAFAVVTERVMLGAIIQPLSRRKPWEVARQTTTVDRLSGGRLVLPVGLGALDDRGFGGVGEATDRRERAERLDESLTILDGLWSGQPFGNEGRHYRFEPMVFRPSPLKHRVPVWVVGAWPHERSMQRVVRHDGILPYVPGGAVTPEVITRIRDWVGARRSLDGFEIVAEGTTPSSDRGAAAETVSEWRDAGATWWVESDWSTFAVDSQRRRIEAGPPAG
jgi:alkanesulfonate monooxygenase SsuD/methylene tetrahydromethanopterin reductase-like flavin-dependent oxidoreductase (luciferase family)